MPHAPSDEKPTRFPDLQRRGEFCLRPRTAVMASRQGGSESGEESCFEVRTNLFALNSVRRQLAIHAKKAGQFPSCGLFVQSE